MQPTLSDMASVMGSVATLLGLSLAWFTFATATRESREESYSGLCSLVTGIEKELELIAWWAGDEEEGDGYLRTKSREDYLKEKFVEWGNPSRTIFSFDYPAIKNLTSSEHASHFVNIIHHFVMLNYAIVRMYNFYAEYREYVLTRPQLYDSVMSKFRSQNASSALPELTPAESEFLGSVFDYNYRIHLGIIGGKDSLDDKCLYKAFNNARKSLRVFKEKDLKSPSSPWWYWIGHVFAAAFLISSFVILYKWASM